MERFNNRFANMFLTNAEIANLNEPAYEDDSDLESLSDSITSLSESIETLSDSFTNESNAIANEIQNYINQLIENRYNNQLITTINTELINSYPGNHQDIENFINNSFDQDYEWIIHQVQHKFLINMIH